MPRPKIRERYREIAHTLTERARRPFAASEALAFGLGGVTAAARAVGVSATVVRRGFREVRAIEAGTAMPLAPTRSRRPGAGRRKITVKDPTLLPDLKAFVESTTRGTPSRRCCAPCEA